MPAAVHGPTEDGAAARAAVRRALDLLKPHLDAFVRQRLAGVPGARVPTSADIQALLGAMLAHPVHFFSGASARITQGHVHALRDARNRWAHEQPLTAREARHIVGTAALLAESIAAPRAVVTELDALVAPVVVPAARTTPARATPVATDTPAHMVGTPVAQGGRQTPVRRPDGVIVNAAELTADDVAMQQVLCPACELKVFAEWAAGWDAHAASPTACRGLTAAGEAARKDEFRTRFGHLFRTPARAVSGTQRDVMRVIWARCGGDDARAVRDYADAERRDEVARARNAYAMTPEAYARRLLADGLAKGWLRQIARAPRSV